MFFAKIGCVKLYIITDLRKSYSGSLVSTCDYQLSAGDQENVRLNIDLDSLITHVLSLAYVCHKGTDVFTKRRRRAFVEIQGYRPSKLKLSRGPIRAGKGSEKLYYASDRSISRYVWRGCQIPNDA